LSLPAALKQKLVSFAGIAKFDGTRELGTSHLRRSGARVYREHVHDLAALRHGC